MSLLYIQGENEKQQGVHYEVDMSQPPLGEGGMGQVRRGVRVTEKNGLRQDVAIKFLFEDLPAHAIERARREASIQVHNENLVEMYGFIEIAENSKGHGSLKRYHVVSELLEGVMLFDLLNGKTTDKFGIEVEYAKELYSKYQNDKFGFAVLVVKNVLSGLMALHDKGYIHRDLDPSNIMITSDRKIKIIDYGIAKRLDSLNTQDQQLTNTGQFVGKAAYAAPELVLGDVHNQNKTTDIYAVGIMLYQFVVGSMPFEGTMAELIEHQLHSKMPLKAVPYKQIRNIISKATAKKQSDRYQSAAEMRVDLEHLTKADAVPSKTAIDMVVELPSGKKKGMIAAAVAVLLVLLGILAVSFNGGPSEEELAKARIDSLYAVRNGMVVDEAGIGEIVDKETGAKMKPVGLLISEALKNLGDTDSLKIEKGVSQLTDVAVKYGNYKHSANALALLAALTQPMDASVSSKRVKDLRNATVSFIHRDASKAHAYAQRAVSADSECYQALFELATDILSGSGRTGNNVDSPDGIKAMPMFAKGLKIAQEKGDSVYIQLFETRIEQAGGVITAE